MWSAAYRARGRHVGPELCASTAQREGRPRQDGSSCRNFVLFIQFILTLVFSKQRPKPGLCLCVCRVSFGQWQDVELLDTTLSTFFGLWT
mmetsp:Transcript_68389/g.160356  ORF Transcript_68389/g.160356 Transcript_68389/m.160356 type:complete len:90 (-) Transcript_68389:80-349(-)